MSQTSMSDTEKKQLPSYYSIYSVEHIEHIYDHIVYKMVIEKRYRDPGYTVFKLTEELGADLRLISSAISMRYRGSFSQMIGDLRTKEAEYMLSDPHFLNRTTEEIGAMAGFANRQSFYNAFIKRRRMTPLEYRRQYFDDNK